MIKKMAIFLSILLLTTSAYSTDKIGLDGSCMKGCISNAMIAQVHAYGDHFERDSFVIMFNKTPGTCQKVWVDAGTKQSERIFEMAMVALIHNFQVDYEVDLDSRLFESDDSICELKWLKLQQH